MSDDQLPPLPTPQGVVADYRVVGFEDELNFMSRPGDIVPNGIKWSGQFTAEQMLEYARTARADLMREYRKLVLQIEQHVAALCGEAEARAKAERERDEQFAANKLLIHQVDELRAQLQALREQEPELRKDAQNWREHCRLAREGEYQIEISVCVNRKVWRIQRRHRLDQLGCKPSELVEATSDLPVWQFRDAWKHLAHGIKDQS